MTPENYLRLMAGDMAGGQPLGRLLLPEISVQAVAHAFMMLGLLSVEGAEAAMTQARPEFARRHIGGPGPGARPRPPDDYWNVRARGQQALAWAPRAVAAGDLRVCVAAVDMRCAWFRTARAGLRFQVQAAATGQHAVGRQVDVALAGLTAADDAGRSYRLRPGSGHGSARLWLGEVVAEPISEHEHPQDVAWLELADDDGQAGRVFFAPPAAIGVGVAAPAWPTPAECYLAWLSRQDPPPTVGVSGGRHVTAAVAESLVAVGAIPEHSPLLPAVLGRHRRSTHPALPSSWPRAVRLGTPPDFQLALCAALPFEHAVAVIEGMSAWGEDVQLHMYGWPWIGGQSWPTAIPSFKVRAIDDLGHEHEGQAGSWRDYGAGEGHGDFTLWPAVSHRAGRLRVVVSTLWEARWADIALPGR